MRIPHLDYKRGFFRFWLVGTAIWLVGTLAFNAYSISYWIGYHYSLLLQHQSISSALAEKENVQNIVLACRAAERGTCAAFRRESTPLRDGDYDTLIAEDLAQRKECVESVEFLAAFIQEQRMRNVPGALNTKSGIPCGYMSDMNIPYVNWAAILGSLLVPLLPLLVYFVGRWIWRGFAKKA